MCMSWDESCHGIPECWASANAFLISKSFVSRKRNKVKKHKCHDILPILIFSFIVSTKHPKFSIYMYMQAFLNLEQIKENYPSRHLLLDNAQACQVPHTTLWNMQYWQTYIATSRNPCKKNGQCYCQRCKSGQENQTECSQRKARRLAKG